MGFNSIIKTIDTKKAGLVELDEQQIEQIHDELKEMLKDIAIFCAKNEIEWSLSGGSVLGAVRHGDIIPWDDDIDINMTRKNYEKFRKQFPDEYKDKYYIEFPGDKNYIFHLPKIVKRNTVFKEIQSIENGNDGLSIDIFIMENTSNNVIFRYLHGIHATILLFIISVSRIERCSTNLLRYSAGNKELINAIRKRRFFSRFFAFRTLEQWIAKADKVFSKVKNDESKFVVIPAGRNHFFKETYRRKKVANMKKTNFGGVEAYIPQDAEYYLSKLYGSDYMTPPPKNKQEKHALIKIKI